MIYREEWGLIRSLSETLAPSFCFSVPTSLSSSPCGVIHHGIRVGQGKEETTWLRPSAWTSCLGRSPGPFSPLGLDTWKRVLTSSSAPSSLPSVDHPLLGLRCPRNRWKRGRPPFLTSFLFFLLISLFLPCLVLQNRGRGVWPCLAAVSLSCFLC